DFNGFNANFSGALNVGTGLQINATTPVISATSNAVFTHDGPAIHIGPGLTVSDKSSATLGFALVSIIDGSFSEDGDVLSANTAGTSITATYSEAAGVLILQGKDTLAHYQQVLRSVTFLTDSSDPTNHGANLTRTIGWLAHDGAATSAEAVSTVSIDAPTAIE